VNPQLFSAEAWIAQENLWLQREVYRLIRVCNDDISKFRRIEDWANAKDKKVDKDKINKDLVDGVKKDYPYRFQNVNFEVNLTLKSDKDNTLVFKIKNLLPRKQKLDLYFRVRMAKSGIAPIFRMSGQALMPKGQPNDYLEHSFKTPESGEVDRTGIYSVEQILSWETAAIKRLDAISIGSTETGDISLSQHDFGPALRPLEEKEQAKPAADDKKDMMGKPGAPPGPGGPQKDGKREDDGGAGGGKVLPNGLWTDRYVEVNEFSRRIPVTVVLIVDQDHVNRVLTHFNNSKFRYLQTQAPLNHYTGSLQAAVGEVQKEGGGGAPPAPGKDRPMGPMSFPMGERNSPAAGGSSEHEANMELIIYGIMTIYQRYPPRSAAAAEKKVQ
jgi:hypothetical protein